LGHWTIPKIEISVPVTPKVCQRALHQGQYEASVGKSVEMGEELIYFYKGIESLPQTLNL